MKHGVVWLCAIQLWSLTAFAVPGPNDLAAYKGAGARLVVLIEAAQEKGERSLLKTSEVMALVKSVTDEKRILRPDSYTAAELGTLLDICDVANKASVSLMLFDLKSHLSPAKTQQQVQAEVVQLVNRNVLEFQAELKELQPFLLRCMAKEVQPMAQFIASLKPAEFTDIRRQGLAQARAGILQIYSGALQAATDTRYRDDYRIALLSTLAETSNDLVSIMQRPMRRQLHESLRITAANAADPYKPHLTRIVSALSTDTCEGLCAIH